MSQSPQQVAEPVPTISLHRYVDVLATRIEDLDERVSKKRKTTREKLAEWSGFIGGFLSLAIAMFTIYDHTLGRKAAEETELRQQLVETTSKIQAINQQIQAAIYSKADPATIAALIAALGAQKAPLVESAKAAVGKLGGGAGASVYMILSSEMANVGDRDAANEYARAAISAPGSNYIHSEAHRMMANLMASLGGPAEIQEARKEFAAALELLGKYPDAAAAQPTATALGNWIMVEATTGSCANIRGLMTRFLSYANNPAVPKPQRNVLTGNLVYAMQAQNNCPFNPEAYHIDVPPTPPPVAASSPAATFVPPAS